MKEHVYNYSRLKLMLQGVKVNLRMYYNIHVIRGGNHVKMMKNHLRVIKRFEKNHAPCVFYFNIRYFLYKPKTLLSYI